MKNLLIITLTIILFTQNASYAQAVQDSSQIEYQIETTDGNIYEGKIIEENDQVLKLETYNLGTIEIRKIEIKRRVAIDPNQFKYGKYWAPNPQATRYFFAPNGFGLKKGEGYYQNVLLFFNQVAFGLSDNFSLGAGTVPLFLFNGTATPVWLTPKLSFPISDGFNIGVGGLLGTVIGAESSSFGVLYGSATIGSRDANVTLGLGWGYFEGDFAQSPTINIGTMLRVRPNTYLLGELYILGSQDSLSFGSLGARSMIKRVGLDYGLMIFIESGFAALPWLGVSVPLGGK